MTSYNCFRLYVLCFLVNYFFSLSIIAQINTIIHFKNAKNLKSIKWFSYFLSRGFQTKYFWSLYDNSTTHLSLFIIFLISTIVFFVHITNFVIVMNVHSLSIGEDLSLILAIVCIVSLLRSIIVNFVLDSYKYRLRDNFAKANNK